MCGLQFTTRCHKTLKNHRQSYGSAPPLCEERHSFLKIKVAGASEGVLGHIFTHRYKMNTVYYDVAIKNIS